MGQALLVWTTVSQETNPFGEDGGQDQADRQRVALVTRRRLHLDGVPVPEDKNIQTGDS